MNTILIYRSTFGIEVIEEMAFHRLAKLAGMNEREANIHGYNRAELINLIFAKKYKPNY